MAKTKIIRQLLRQSPFLAFSAEDLKKVDQRYRSRTSIYVRFGYQWTDEHDHSRKHVSKALGRTLKEYFGEVKSSFPTSDHELNFASLRAQAGKPVLHKIVLDILSADMLFLT
jgi:hypothetical protein